jgi:hypothetical protein
MKRKRLLPALWNAEFGIRIAEGESKGKESGNRSQETRARHQDSGNRSEEKLLLVARCRFWVNAIRLIGNTKRGGT